ncbi:prolyl 4-hydroxylase subunit alpha-1-like [Ylistrum balloti]|uniref:prolyl 4-hydroxylase subunit alpha-1-like n=1 Tax=Ylistrum balloti TaxID=509963 RepID=UPI002905F00D|nr:prolyl 4-hydroxylase subunit alpha-1-like [Ylistrum balloti]
MKTRKMFIRICVIITCLQFVNSQAFSSIRNLEIVYAEEGKLVKALRDFVNRSKAEGLPVADSITGFLKDVEDARSHVHDVELWMSHPINALYFVSRIATKWGRIISSIECETCLETDSVKDFTSVWTAAKQIPNYWPTLLDTHQIYKSILAFWNFYDLDLIDILNGKIGEKQTYPLTSAQVIEMVKHSKYGNRRYAAVVWLQALHDRRNNTKLDVDENVSEQELDFELATAYAEYMFPEKVVDIMSKYEDSDDRLTQLRYDNLVRQAYQIPIQYRQNAVERPKRNWNEDRIQHKALCKGNVTQTANVHFLKCLYRPTRISYYRVKEEIVHQNPRVSIFHGLISELEIQELRRRADNQLKQSLSAEEKKHWVKFQISQSAWMADSEDRMLNRINHRIKLVTGLNTAHAEQKSLMNQHEILNFGVGGMHLYHYDAMVKNEFFDINRFPEKQRNKVMNDMDKMATWMFHLSSVEEGGATVFPRLGVRVPATKGLALFWYNMDEMGSVDERMIIAECPVLIGSKWTSKKWMSYEENRSSFS